MLLFSIEVLHHSAAAEFLQAWYPFVLLPDPVWGLEGGGEAAAPEPIAATPVAPSTWAEGPGPVLTLECWSFHRNEQNSSAGGHPNDGDG